MTAYSFKRRFVAPIRAGLGLVGLGMDGAGNEVPCELVLDDGVKAPRPFDPMRDLDPPIRPKRQTIRAVGRRRHARPGEVVQLYHGMRTKQCFLIGRARCVSVEPIEIIVKEHSMPTRLSGKHVGGGFLREFARADGFESAEDMLAFWREEHGLGKFEGLLIRWEPL